jgi:uncharacterized protein (DUF1800 family)
MRKFAVLFTIWAVCPAFGRTRPPALNVQAAARFLEQATWGPTAASIAEIENIGIDAWLKWQFSLNTSDLPDQPVLGTDGKANHNLAPVQAAFFANAVGGDDQLRQRVAFALSEIWVVSAIEVPDAYAFPPYWRIFRDHAFGNYRDIIHAVTLNPAMGRYLNIANNNKGNAARGTSANENYGRELMQLFTLGLTQMNADGGSIADKSGAPVPTYTQAEVTNISRALTGWTYPTAPGVTAKANNPAYYDGEMFAVEQNHDTTQKDIFGDITIPAGQTAAKDLESVLDALMAQPTMAPFVCRQLIQHLVTSNPSPGYISRVSNVFLDNGRGVRGDLKAVITAILTDSEARSGDDPNSQVAANFGHLREPVLLIASVLRGLNATLGGSSLLYPYSNQLGQNLFYPPSVFSYFSPQYRTRDGLLAPEFQIYSTQTAALRAGFVNAVLYGTLDKTTRVDLTPFLPKLTNDYATLLGNVSRVFLHSQPSTDVLIAAYQAAKAATTPVRAVEAALYIALTSGEYQVIH